MEVLRRDTDYALRAMVYLAGCYDKKITSVKQLSRAGKFSYHLGHKLLQKLSKAGLVKSYAGPKGGFALNKKPSEINLMEIIEVFQGGIRLNKCLVGNKGCEFEPECEINTKLFCLQMYIDGYLGGITLEEILRSQSKAKSKAKSCMATARYEWL